MRFKGDNGASSQGDSEGGGELQCLRAAPRTILRGWHGVSAVGQSSLTRLVSALAGKRTLAKAASWSITLRHNRHPSYKSIHCSRTRRRSRGRQANEQLPRWY